MKTERELFELWCIKDDEFCIHRYDGSDDYSDDYTQSAWLAWQASASREGYKLVPAEKLEELKRDADRMISSAYLYQDECHIKSFGRSFLHNYKAMIGDEE